MYPKMKRIYTYIIIPLLCVATGAFAQDAAAPSQIDSVVLGNMFGLSADGNVTMGTSVFDKSPEIDIAKALYGQFSGLLVKQGTGRSEENQSSLKLRGFEPLILVDGLPRDLDDLTGLEIDKITVLKDAASAALYGAKGANGVIMITTKRGEATPLKVTAKYQYGLALPTRTPQFADAYTYAYMVNQACDLDGIAHRYSNADLQEFYKYVDPSSGTPDPYAYPNVDWWSEIYRSHGDNHRAQFTFTGGNRNFRYFTAVDYLKDNAMYVRPTADDRYNGHVYDNRLSLRANVDVNITDYTAMKVGVMARLAEFNKTYYQRSSSSIERLLYKIPSAAFPIKQADGTYGGTDTYGAANPVANFQESGQGQYSQTKVLANMTLRQDLSPVLPGLSADATVAFDYIGKLTETASKSYRYAELVDGSLKYTGVDSKTVSFSHWFSSLAMKMEFQARMNYERAFGDHHIDAHLAYRQRSWLVSGRNRSYKTQEIIGTASYNWKERIFADVVLNYSGASVFEPGKRFNWYPAINLSGIVLQEPFYLKAFASFGLSGDFSDIMEVQNDNGEYIGPELWRQAYSDDQNAHSYSFGQTGTGYGGYAEDDMAATTLAPEQAATANIGLDARFLDRRLGLLAEGFYTSRTKALIKPENVSGVLGLGLNPQSIGAFKYWGSDLALSWDDKMGELEYGLYANGGLLFSKVVNDGQAYQAYDYLYHKGNSAHQCYGLEAIGYFKDQAEIDAAPRQTFGEVRPGDIRYKDQNSDDKIDDQDIVKMAGTSFPTFNYGFGLHASFKGFTVYADFQGQAGVTVNLLRSPLYKPIANNYTISLTYLNREIPWTPENADNATMPRLTTQSGENNFQDGSQWYRDGSFLKLRNIGISYTIPKRLLKVCDATVSLTATNLFSLDNIQFADPEQLGAYYPTTRVFWASVKFNF